MSKNPPPHGHRWDDRYNLRPNDYDYDYPQRGPGPYPPPDLTDEAQWVGLDPAAGEEMVPRREFNSLWGKTVKLHGSTPNPMTSLTFITTPVARRPVAIAVQARFSLDGINYTPEVPAAYSGNPVQVRVTRSVDIKAGAFRESFEVAQGAVLPFCVLIARQLTVAVEISGDPLAPDLWVALVACPVETIDCVDLVGPTGTVTPGYTETVVNRFSAAGFASVGANPKRAMVTVVNQSTVDLFVKLGEGVNISPESATIVLPGGVDAGCQYDNYRGVVEMRFDGDDSATGYALVTEGFYS